MEHFWFLKDQRINLSDPNPQLAAFMHHYQALPADMISTAMASLILLSNLPLTTSVAAALVQSQLKPEAEPSLAEAQPELPSDGSHISANSGSG